MHTYRKRTGGRAEKQSKQQKRAKAGLLLMLLLRTAAAAAALGFHFIPTKGARSLRPHHLVESSPSRLRTNNCFLPRKIWQHMSQGGLPTSSVRRPEPWVRNAERPQSQTRKKAKIKLMLIVHGRARHGRREGHGFRGEAARGGPPIAPPGNLAPDSSSPPSAG